MNKKHTFWIFVFLAPALAVFCVVYLAPLITVVASSFTQWNGYEKMKFIGLGNYREMFSDGAFRAAFINSAKWALWASLVHVPFGVIVAMILAKRPRGWRFTRAVFMIPNIIAPTAMAILFLFVYKPEVGILNGFIKLLGFNDFNINWLYDPRTAFVSVTMIWLPYAAVITLITMAELLSVPQSIYEAARIDGAAGLQIDLYINLPLLWKIIGTGEIIAITAALRKFDVIFLTTNGGPGDLTMNISVMMVNSIFNTMRYGYANALGTMLLVMGMVTILVVQKIFKMGESSFE